MFKTEGPAQKQNASKARNLSKLMLPERGNEETYIAWGWQHTHTRLVGRMNVLDLFLVFNFLSLKWQTATELGRPRLQFTYLFLMIIVIKMWVTGSRYQSQWAQGQLQKKALGFIPGLVLEKNKYATQMLHLTNSPHPPQKKNQISGIIFHIVVILMKSNEHFLLRINTYLNPISNWSIKRNSSNF